MNSVLDNVYRLGLLKKGKASKSGFFSVFRLGGNWVSYSAVVSLDENTKTDSV